MWMATHSKSQNGLRAASAVVRAVAALVDVAIMVEWILIRRGREAGADATLELHCVLDKWSTVLSSQNAP